MDISTGTQVIRWLRTIFNCIPPLKPENPRKIESKFSPESLVGKIREKYRHLQQQGAGGRIEGQEWRDKMNQWAQWYELRADILWGRPSPRHRHRSAWLYATAGELYRLADLNERASLIFEFAAHGFREVDRLSQSINYFRKSAELTSKPEWKNRCYTRAYGIAQITGDKQTAENCRKQIQNFSSPENSAPLPQSN